MLSMWHWFVWEQICITHNDQWRAKKLLMGGFIQWHVVVICIWCPLFVTLQFDVIFMFPNQLFGEVFWHNMRFLLHALPLIYTSQFDVTFVFPNQLFGEVFWHKMHILLHALPLICVSLNWTISAPGRISEENATTQQFITAKIWGCALEQGSEIHSSLRQSNSQLQNEALLMSCRIRAVEHRTCAAGLSDARPGLQDRILLNTQIENAHKVRKKNSWFFIIYRIQQNFGFPFFLLKHYQIPECFYFNNCCFWARATVLSCYRNW